jgi:hypothetical protein
VYVRMCVQYLGADVCICTADAYMHTSVWLICMYVWMDGWMHVWRCVAGGDHNPPPPQSVTQAGSLTTSIRPSIHSSLHSFIHLQSHHHPVQRRAGFRQEQRLPFFLTLLPVHGNTDAASDMPCRYRAVPDSRLIHESERRQFASCLVLSSFLFLNSFRTQVRPVSQPTPSFIHNAVLFGTAGMI